MLDNFNGHAGALNIADDWSTKSKNLMKKYAKLTTEDLKFVPGQEIDLIRNIENRLNKEREWVVSLIRNA